MGRVKVSVVLKIMILGLMVGSIMAESVPKHHRNHRKVHGRELRHVSTPLSGFNPASVCGGLGPVCPAGVHIECVVGGIVGCICSLVHTCQPTVSGCMLFDGASVTSCGF
ncbi:uncharacterized protein [Physcomitrium patens]|uniref:uncharacterized protein isoform X2 n=1 Tax=Physcomitrium patens TaxID=3218 RepID=UPI000D178314|nr:uncharacterized protein LOC112283947 isoform X2 [Physcomitrium patens]|eukprot:XP_024379132.1 uncharacterized protein LOC112283947 isoform X2 [Physcomitrella patens]